MVQGPRNTGNQEWEGILNPEGSPLTLDLNPLAPGM